MSKFLCLLLPIFTACANFTQHDKAIIDIEKCTPKGESKIPSSCANDFISHVFTGNYISMRSKYIGSFVGNVTLEIKTGEKSIMCKTEVNDQNIAFLRALKKGDPIKASGTPTIITRFKSSYHSYILLENCTFAF